MGQSVSLSGSIVVTTGVASYVMLRPLVIWMGPADEGPEEDWREVCLPSPISGQSKIDFREMQAKCDRMLQEFLDVRIFPLPNHHHPTGTTMRISSRAEFTRFCVQLVAAHGGIENAARELHHSPFTIHRALSAFLPEDESILVDIATHLSGRVVIPERCYLILDPVVEEDG